MELPVSTILSIAKFSQYITASKMGSHDALQGGDINERWARIIYMERMAVQNRYNLNPSDPTLQGTANYLYSLLRYVSEATTRRNNLAGALPVLTGPTNQSVTVGNTATFSVSVTSSTNVTYQWLLNNVVIPGATNSSYLVTNAQLAQSGGLYSVQVTNATGTVTSNQATLTVTATLVGYWYAGATDYSTQLLSGTDDVPWNGTFSYTSGQPLVVPFPAGALAFIAIKYPTSETLKTHYANPAGGIDAGPIPGLALETNVFGGNNYIFSRTGNQFGVNSGSGQVTFS